MKSKGDFRQRSENTGEHLVCGIEREWLHRAELTRPRSICIEALAGGQAPDSTCDATPHSGYVASPPNSTTPLRQRFRFCPCTTYPCFQEKFSIALRCRTRTPRFTIMLAPRARLMQRNGGRASFGTETDSYERWKRCAMFQRPAFRGMRCATNTRQHHDQHWPVVKSNIQNGRPAQSPDCETPFRLGFRRPGEDDARNRAPNCCRSVPVLHH
jgi:hypothetical protein